MLQVALAPGDGLLLENVAYDNYNRQTTTKFPVMMQMVHQKAEVEAFRKEIVSYIAQREIKERAFTCWLCYLDDNKEDYYIQLKKTSEGENKLLSVADNKSESDGAAELEEAGLIGVKK